MGNIFDEFDKPPDQRALPPEYAPPAAAIAPTAAAAPAASDNMFDQFDRAKPVAVTPSPVLGSAYRGSILPLSRDERGIVQFDPFGAGPIGAARQAFTLPGRVASGETPMPASFDPAMADPRAAPIIGEAMNFAGTYGPANPMVRSGDPAVPGVAMRPKDMRLAPTPTGAELLERGGQQIDAYRNMPIAYNPQHMGTLATQMEQALIKDGVFPEDAKGLYTTINRLRDYAPRSDDPNAAVRVDPANLISIRKNIAAKFGVQGENQHGVGVAHRIFNDFLENPPPEALVAGTPAAARVAAIGSDVYRAGLGNYAAGKRDAELEAIQREAGLRSSAANSGQNLDNTIRSRITSAILNAKRLKGFTPAEEAMLEKVPEGSTGANLLRKAGNLMGGGLGAGAGVAGTIGGSVAHGFGLPFNVSTGIGMAIPVAGAALKRAAGKSTSEALGEVQQATRQRSPLFLEQAQRSDLVPDIVPGRDAIARILMQRTSRPDVNPFSTVTPAPAAPPTFQPGVTIRPDGTIEERT